MARKFYTKTEFITRFRISERTFFRWKKRGVFRYTQVGGKILIEAKEVERLEKSHLENA